MKRPETTERPVHPEAPDGLPRLITFLQKGRIQVGYPSVRDGKPYRLAIKRTTYSNGEPHVNYEEFPREELIEGERWLNQEMERITSRVSKEPEHWEDWAIDQFERFDNSHIPPSEISRMGRLIILFYQIRNRWGDF